MARDQTPMTEDEIERAREEIHDLFDEVRQDIASEQGSPVPDGGE